MYRPLLRFCVLIVMAPAALAQTPPWTLPSNCPLHVLSQTEQTCQLPSHGQPHKCEVAVTVTPPTGDSPCIASIQNGTLLAKLKVKPLITWKINSACATGKCKFDKDTGIAVLSDPNGQLFGKAFSATAPHLFKWNDKNDPHSEVGYEPHVMWRIGPDQWQSCCPIDPRIVNEGQ